jgi:hypothetical protein
MQIRLVKMAGAYSKHFNICLFWYYIKQIMNVFIRAMVRIFSFGERWNVPFNSAVVSLNGTFHLSPHENILTIARINIHYLYNSKKPSTFSLSKFPTNFGAKTNLQFIYRHRIWETLTVIMKKLI